MAKLTLSDLLAKFSSITTINANNDLIEAALENTLSRDGTTPNEMTASLDMNSNKILNLPTAVASTDPIIFTQFKLANLTDVDLTGLADTQGIVWNATTSKWEPSTTSAPVASVNGKIGVVLLSTDDIAEGVTNFYMTAAQTAKLAGIDAGATDDQTGAEIKALYEAEANAFTDALFTKLGTIETSATADQTGAEIKTAYEAEANAYTDTKDTKLSGIEAAATADQTGAEIKTAYEAEVNAFTDAQFTKLAGIATGAEVNDDNPSLARDWFGL